MIDVRKKEARLENVVSVPCNLQRESLSFCVILALKFLITETKYPDADSKSAIVRQTISLRVKLRISGIAIKVAIISNPPSIDKEQLETDRIRDTLVVALLSIATGIQLRHLALLKRELFNCETRFYLNESHSSTKLDSV